MLSGITASISDNVSAVKYGDLCVTGKINRANGLVNVHNVMNTKPSIASDRNALFVPRSCHTFVKA